MSFQALFCSIIIFVITLITDLFCIFLSYTCLSFFIIECLLYYTYSSFSVCFILMLVHWCTGLVGGFVDVRGLWRSNSKTALNTWCACLICMYVCDFYDSVWSTCWSQGGLSKSSSVSIALLLTSINRPSHTDGGTSHLCTCRDVTLGNHRYLQVCMRVCVFTGQLKM